MPGIALRADLHGSRDRSILVIVWHLLADPTTRYHDLGSTYHATRIDTGRKIRNHIRQLQALGFTVTLAPTA